MIRKYTPADKSELCNFFYSLIEGHKDYISHGELQMGIATDIGVLSPEYKKNWEAYLEKQISIPDNSILLYEEDRELTGFILFGITNDGAKPYGVVFDLGIKPASRGKHVGLQLLQEAISHFRKQGIQDCYLESGVNNHSAHDFFRKHGFIQVSDIFRLKL